MKTTLKHILFRSFACVIASSASAEIVLHYEFNEADATVASSAANTGTSVNTAVLGDGYGTMNGSGQLVVSTDSGRVNTSMASDIFSGTIFYRIDFDSWDTSGANKNIKFGFRLRSGDTDTSPLNKNLEVTLASGTGATSNISTAASTGSGVFNYIQGGFANPNTGGVSFIIGANTTTDTYSIWWDNGLSGTYTLLRENIALNLGGETDFVNVNALTFDPSGGLFLIDRIALGTDFNEIIAISGEDDGDDTDSDDLFLQYEFNEAEDTLASGAASIGSSQNTEALGDGYGSINGNGHLTTSADADRVNTSLVSDVFGGTIFYRIDFAGWDNAGANIATKFGFRLRSADIGNTQTNHLFEVSLNTGIGDNSANINTSASGSYSYVQGGMANPNTAGVSFILGVDTSTDTFSIWWDNGLTDSYTVLQENIALNLGGVTDFVSVNALTFDAGGAGVIIDRIAMDSDFLKISTFHIEDDGDDTDSVARIAELESQLAAVTAERDALPTQDAYDAVVAERDARLTEAQVRDARTGSVLFEVGAENNATISLVMEETGDLSDWDSGTTSSHDIAVTVPAGQDIRFYRFKIE